MEYVEFKDYKTYVDNQKRTVMRRTAGPFFTEKEIDAICYWLKRHEHSVPSKGVCHGARSGLEADCFVKHFPDIYIFGTDLFPFSGATKTNPGKSRVIQQDFSRQKKRWVECFDFVYSNSLDHAQDPLFTLNTWFEQLVPDGHLFVQWNKGNLYAKGGDCFGGHLDEWIDVMNQKGKVIDLIYTNVPFVRKNPLQRRGLETTIIVGVKK